MSLLEIAAIILNVISVYLVVINHKANWWVGMLGTTALMFYFMQNNLPGQVMIQITFLLQGIYGMLSWSLGNNEILLPEKDTVKWYDVLAVVLTFVGLGLVSVYDGGLDYSTAVVSMYATYLMARKFIVHWIIWMFVDLLSIIMFMDKGMYGMAVLYGLFFGMCIHGFLNWTKVWFKQENNKDNFYGKQTIQ